MITSPVTVTGKNAGDVPGGRFFLPAITREVSVRA